MFILSPITVSDVDPNTAEALQQGCNRSTYPGGRKFRGRQFETQRFMTSFKDLRSVYIKAFKNLVQGLRYYWSGWALESGTGRFGRSR